MSQIFYQICTKIAITNTEQNNKTETFMKKGEFWLQFQILNNFMNCGAAQVKPVNFIHQIQNKAPNHAKNTRKKKKEEGKETCQSK